MLVLTNVSEVIWQFANRSYNTLQCNDPTQIETLRWDVVWMSLSGLGVSVPFTLAHWIFAERYWVLSYKLESIVKRDADQPNLKMIKLFSWVIIVNIVGWQLLATIAFLGMDLGNMPSTGLPKFLLYFGMMTQVIFDIVSIVVLTVAFRRIQQFAGSELEINHKMMNIHLVSYALTVVSLFLFIGSNINASKQVFTASTILVALTSFFS